MDSIEGVTKEQLEGQISIDLFARTPIMLGTGVLPHSPENHWASIRGFSLLDELSGAWNSKMRGR
jgi:hypothetical protein